MVDLWCMRIISIQGLTKRRALATSWGSVNSTYAYLSRVNLHQYLGRNDMPLRITCELVKQNGDSVD